MSAPQTRQTRTPPGALGPWPRRAAVLITALSMTAYILFGLHDRESGPVSVGQVLQGAAWLGLIGAVIAALTRPRDANPWRTSGVWALLLLYAGLVLSQLDYEWATIGQYGALGFDWWFMAMMYVAAVPVCAYTLAAFVLTYVRAWRRPHPPLSLAVSGRQMGATALAVFLVVFGLLVALRADTTRLTPRAVAVLLGYAVGTAALVAGTVLQARQGRRSAWAAVLLWSAVAVLVGVAILDSFAPTSPSGLRGDYPYSATPFDGLGPFVLPAGVVALVGVLRGGQAAAREPDATDPLTAARPGGDGV